MDDKTRQSLPDGVRQKLENVKFIDAYNEVQNSTLLNDDKISITERQSQKIRSVEDLEVISKSSIERGLKDRILLAASANFKFNEIFDPVCAMQLTEIQKLDLLRLLVQNKPVEDFIVEWYDTHLGEKQIVILPYIKPEITSATYVDHVKQSKLLDFEKTALLKQLDNFFNPQTEIKKKKTRQLKLKVDEKTGEVDETQLLQ
jgi:hypothetical protein